MKGVTFMPKQLKERVQVGVEKKGKPIYKWVTGYSQQELFMNAAMLLQEYGLVHGQQKKEKPSSPYFKAYVERWFELYKEPKLRQTTKSSYLNLIKNHLIPHFKGMRLEEITTSTVQELFNAKSSMAKSTVRQMRIILHQVFDLAVEDEYMKRNPTDSKRLYISSDKVEKREALEDHEVKAIIRGIPCLKREDGMLLALLIFTGMRRGEALALRWEDIDWKKRLIAVKRAITYKDNRPVLGKTKSDAGNRLIPLDDQLAAILQPCRQLGGFIIGGSDPISETAFKRMWERIGKKINLYGATPHVFRHTYITLAASSGIDVKTLQSIAGHSDIKMTMDRYAHKRENNIIAAGGLISSVFRSM